MHGENKWRQGMPKNPTDPMSQKTEEAPQAECDERGPDYDNNTKEKWLTGAVPATKMPHYDSSKKWK
jgi:hypothetical protein